MPSFLLVYTVKFLTMIELEYGYAADDTMYSPPTINTVVFTMNT